MITNLDTYTTGRLMARPAQTTATDTLPVGEHSLNLDGDRDGLIYIPKNYKPGRPAALALMLHGAGGVAGHGMSYLREYADDNNILLLAPASRSSTWDIISFNTFGPDVLFIDQAMALVFERYAINPEHIAISGFSDGASYALSLGLTNGDLFTHILAFSPGFVHTKEKVGQPSVFIAHGTKDPILPIEPCSRHIVPQLRRQGYDTSYIEFDGEHEIPHNISKKSIEWFIRGGIG
ncbi:alpha/beta hydrolase [Telluribacter humicola]|uniref:alpha/beta hydrolase n=1 Tax=Telluribacter humicola TaxID=1720261 RepID=UPI001A97B5D3|nr:alpha/beta hydrolase-fold protein [Telluribacter humicola]